MSPKALRKWSKSFITGCALGRCRQCSYAKIYKSKQNKYNSIDDGDYDDPGSCGVGCLHCDPDFPWNFNSYGVLLIDL